MSEFVPASELYDIESRTPIAHPAHQATDADVRRALEQREVRIDGGDASSGTVRSGKIRFGMDGDPEITIYVPLTRAASCNTFSKLHQSLCHVWAVDLATGRERGDR